MATNAPEPPARGFANLGALSGYQWFVLVVCCMAWSMDCLDQQLFLMARNSAMGELVHQESPGLVGKELGAAVLRASTDATFYFMIGWGVGGIAFGILGDRVGRVKTLMLTILLYALFTGLNAFSRSIWDFDAARFLTGLGVGGVFAAAVTLLAETMPDRARPFALGLFQASSVVGNCGAALISMYLGHLKGTHALDGLTLLGTPMSPWRIMFLIGVLPGFLVVVIQARLREPEKWQQARLAGIAGVARPSLWREFRTDATFQRHALLGLILALAGIIGLWGIGFFSYDLLSYVSEPVYRAEAAAKGLTGDEVGQYVQGQKAYWSGVTSLVQNFGSFWGIFAFSLVTARLGRRPTFAIFFALAALATATVFLFLKEWSDIFWMVPIMGFFQLAIFGGYAIYLPELFSTRLRSTGTSFCYNAGRLIAAFGPVLLGKLAADVYGGYETPLPFRYAGVTMCATFLVGIAVLPFLPETRGKPLPE